MASHGMQSALPASTMETVLEELRALRSLFEASRTPAANEAVNAAGLLSYEDLQRRLTIGKTNPRVPCMRTVKALVRRHRKIIGPVSLGHTLVGFRPANVEKLIAHLAGEEPAGARRL